MLVEERLPPSLQVRPVQLELKLEHTGVRDPLMTTVAHAQTSVRVYHVSRAAFNVLFKFTPRPAELQTLPILLYTGHPPFTSKMARLVWIWARNLNQRANVEMPVVSQGTAKQSVWFEQTKGGTWSLGCPLCARHPHPLRPGVWRTCEVERNRRQGGKLGGRSVFRSPLLDGAEGAEARPRLRAMCIEKQNKT